MRKLWILISPSGKADKVRMIERFFFIASTSWLIIWCKRNSPSAMLLNSRSTLKRRKHVFNRDLTLETKSYAAATAAKPRPTNESLSHPLLNMEIIFFLILCALLQSHIRGKWNVKYLRVGHRKQNQRL